MTRDVATIGPEASVAQAWELCRERRVRHLPIVEEGRLIGLVSDRDLRDASPPRGAGGEETVFGWSSMRDIMTTNLVTVQPRDTIDRAAKEIHDRRIGCLPVVDNGELAGIITSSDMMQTLVEVFGAYGPGTWLEVSVQNQPGTMAAVMDVIRTRQVNIASALVAPGPRSRERLVVLRLETTNPSAIVRELEDAGYPVTVVESSVPFETTREES